MKFRRTVKIFAKGMLFGEYAVLQGFPAVAVTFPSPCFLIDLTLLQPADNGKITIKSAFFRVKEIEFASSSLDESVEKDEDSFFFKNLLAPWSKFLKECHLTIDIKTSFMPSLGFGSSSAIIAGISAFLAEYFLGFENASDLLSSEEFWLKLRESLMRIQGNGSGYDIGVQLASYSRRFSHTQCWKYLNQLEKKTAVPLIENFGENSLDMKTWGCFVKTHSYSNTSKVLNKFQTQKNKYQLVEALGEISNLFLQQPTTENIAFLMKESREICSNFFSDDLFLQDIFKRLDSVPFKTMGAGGGDCLWVLCSQAELIKLGFQESDIAFAFEREITSV